MYYEQDLPDADPRWAGYPNWNWTRDRVVHPSDTFVQDQPELTCFWYGYRAQNGVQVNPDLNTINHGGRRTNLLYTDGSALSWKLPQTATGISPVWGWFDAGAYTKADFRTGSLQHGFVVAGYPADFYTQMPWWWVEAARGNR
jgi:prepilin-type processing-associated H-X9-DG protein